MGPSHYLPHYHLCLSLCHLWTAHSKSLLTWSSCCHPCLPMVHFQFTVNNWALLNFSWIMSPPLQPSTQPSMGPVSPRVKAKVLTVTNRSYTSCLLTFLGWSLTTQQVYSASASLVFLLVSEHGKHVSTSGLLHLLLPQPEMIFPF